MWANLSQISLKQQKKNSSTHIILNVMEINIELSIEYCLILFLVHGILITKQNFLFTELISLYF